MALTPTPSAQESAPTSERIRLTISVTPEVHAAFQRLSAAGNMSISRAMGEWLGDTLEAVEFMAAKMEQARAAPRLVVRELQSFALGMVDETNAMMDALKKGRPLAAGREVPQCGTPGQTAADGLSPPSSNTGGKGARKGGKSRGAGKS